MATWEELEDYRSKLQLHGKNLYRRFIHPQSKLHDAQKEALKELVNWFSNTHAIKDTKDKTAVVVMPTGTGKTGVICCLPYTLMGTLSSAEINMDKPVLIIAPGVDILYQLEENLSGTSNSKSFLENIGLLEERDIIQKKANYSVHVTGSAADVADLEHKQSDIILSNSQKWRKKKSADYTNYENLPSDLFSMVIVDEAHHLPAKQWAEIVRKFKANAKIIFFTATPYRADGKEITEDHALSTKGFAYKLNRKMAVTQNLIRKIFFKEIEYSKPPEKRIKLTAENYSSRKQDEASKRMTYALEVLTEVKKCMDDKNRDHPLPGGKQHAAIIVAKNIDEADYVRKICIQLLGFGYNKVKVVHTAKIKTWATRRAVTKEIKDGHFQVVIVVQMLLEGFDYPPFSIVGIVTNIQSQRKFAQSVGRIQRLVRHDEEGHLEIETGGIGHIITHEFFEQGDLYDTEFETHITEDVSSEEEEEEEEFEDETKGEFPFIKISQYQLKIAKLYHTLGYSK